MSQQQHTPELIEANKKALARRQQLNAAKKQATTGARPMVGNLQRPDSKTACELVQPGGSPSGPTIGTAVHATRQTSCPTKVGSTAVPSPSPTGSEWETPNGQNNLTAIRQRDGVVLDNRPKMVGSGWMADAFADYQHPAPASPPIQPQTAVTVDYSTHTAVVPCKLLNELTRANMAGPGRLFVLARAMAPEAAYIGLQRLQETAVTMWNRSQYYEWLSDGDGRLWDIGTDGRMWIYGPARIAQAMGFGRYDRKRMELKPADVATAKQFKQASYNAAILRLGKTRTASQATIKEMTGLSPRTQCYYSKEMRIVHRQNFVVTDDRWQPDNIAKHALNGRHVFEFTDSQGRRGEPGRSYVAFVAPSGSSTNAAAVGWGRKRKTNSDIDPVLKRRGNGGVRTVFHETASDAAKTWSKAGADHDVFWIDKRGLKQSPRTRTRLLPYAIHGAYQGANSHVNY